MQADSTAGDAVHAAIEAGNEAFIRALGDADAGAFAALYDEDGARLLSGGRVIRGPRRIRDSVAEFLQKTGPIDVSIRTAELWVVDSLVYETGGYVFAWGDGAGREDATGQYMTVWKRQADGGWKIFRDMDVPLLSSTPSTED